jgi:hypothetical protein
MIKPAYAKFRIDGRLYTRAQIAQRFGVNQSTVNQIIRKADKSSDIKRLIEDLKLKGPHNQKLFRYKDGRKLTIKEICNLEPQVKPGAFRYRYGQYGPDYPRLYDPSEKPQGGEGKKEKIPVSFGLGPRKRIEDVTGPTSLEREIHGY